MKIKVIIEYGPDLDWLEVEFEGWPDWTDDAYDDEYGTVRNMLHPDMDDIIWNRKHYTEAENEIIFAYLSSHWMEVEEIFFKEFLKEENNY